jgi:hypothetical protein
MNETIYEMYLRCAIPRLANVFLESESAIETNSTVKRS